MKKSYKKILSLCLLSVGLITIIPSSSIAAKYKRVESVIAADFMPDGKIVFVKNIKVESYPLIYDPHSLVFGGPVKTLSDNTYLCSMTDKGREQKILLKFPTQYYPIRFWKGKKLCVVDTTSLDTPDIDTRLIRIIVADMEKLEPYVVHTETITVSSPDESLIKNHLWSQDGQAILLMRGNSGSKWKFNLTEKRLEPTTNTEWDSAWDRSLNKDPYYRNPDSNSEAYNYARKIIKPSEKGWLFFRPPWWKD